MLTKEQVEKYKKELEEMEEYGFDDVVRIIKDHFNCKSYGEALKTHWEEFDQLWWKD